MDPVTYSIIRHRLFRVIDEAVITLKHISGSATTNEGHDLLVGLYRADGSLLTGGLGFLNHMVYAAEDCKVIIRRFTGDINEDDIFLLNDPYTAAAHTSDIYLISPIHYKGQLVAWSACYVHISDVGALNPGGFSPDSRDIYTEGFSSPGIKLVAGGETRQDIFDTVLNMVRSPEMVGPKQDVSWGVFPLMNQDALYVATNGGGGYLDPLERDPEAVLADVSDCVVSREAAKAVYGTVLDETSVDLAATAELRRTMIARRKEAR